MLSKATSSCQRPRSGPLARKSSGALLVLALSVVSFPPTADAQLRDREVELDNVRRVVLQQPDSLYIGDASSVWVDAESGHVYVSDGFSNRVVRYSRDGVPLAQYGSPGGGPGEIRDAGEVFVVDSLVVVADVGSNDLVLFEKSGRFVREVDYKGVLGTISLKDSLVFAGALRTQTGLLRWNVTSDRISYGVPVPSIYTELAPLAGIYTGVAVQVLPEDKVLYGFMGTDWIAQTDRSLGESTDRIEIPAVRRRGVPDNVHEAFQNTNFPEKFSALSALFDLHRLPNGTISVIHFDQAYHRGRRASARVYLSLLKLETRPIVGCLDKEIPVSEVAQPEVAWRRDTLFVLHRNVDVERRKAEAIIDVYSVRGCKDSEDSAVTSMR